MTDLTINEDIEGKVKDILISKLQKNNIQDLNEHDIQTIKKLFELFPAMKKKFGKYLDNKTKINQDENTEIILDEIEINDITYYKDIRGGLWDTDANLIGIATSYENNQGPKYVLFDQKFKTDLDLDLDLEN